MKEQILKLREQGKTYSQIQKELGCSKSTISYHCSDGQKEKNLERTKKNRKKPKVAFMHKLDSYKRKQYNSKYRDFQRLREGGGWKDNGECMYDFSKDDLYNKLLNNPKCYLTGEMINLDLPKTYSFDHIIPVSKGGKSNIENLGLCLREVNTAKNNLLLEDFIELCKKVLLHNGYEVIKKVV